MMHPQVNVKEFGADGFYGPSPSREWTNQTLISARRVIAASDGWQASVQSYYRTHGDRFLYDERNPGVFENRHRTHSAGTSVLARRRISDTLDLSFGAEGGGEWITSTNLGDHAEGRGSRLVEGRIAPGRRLVIYPGLRLDYYSNFGSAFSPSLSASWWASQRLRLRASVGRAFRAPTFTERYYFDPNHQAQPDLRPEKSWGAEAGADLYISKAWIATANAQLRREGDVIDWVRSSPAEKWVTANIRHMTFSGGQLGLERVFDSGRHRLRAGYAYVNGDPGSIDYYSKYALDYARHSLLAAAVTTLPLSLGYSQKIEYRRRADGRAYWVLDSRLSRRFGSLVLNFDCANLTDSHYQEVSGVDMPGRWIVLQLAWDVSRH